MGEFSTSWSRTSTFYQVYSLFMTILISGSTLNFVLIDLRIGDTKTKEKFR